MLEDSNNSLLEYLRDRTTSPLFGAFVLSWSIWNYKCILALLSHTPLEEKIQFIEMALYPDLMFGIFQLFVGPLITAVAYLFIYPFPAAKVYEFWRQKQKELRDIKLKIEDESLLTLEESKRIRKQVIEIQAEYESQLRKNSDEIEGLKDSLVRSQRELEDAYENLNKATSSKVTVSAKFVSASKSELEGVLLAQPYRLVFNPMKGKSGSKIMLFGPKGKILEGNNQNEASWRITDGKLELIQDDGLVHSRFNFDVPTAVFTHTGDTDTRSTKGQYLAPEPNAA